MYNIKIVSGKVKEFRGLRMPTDQEWKDYERARRIITPRNGGKRFADPKGDAVVVELLRKLSDEELPAFDAVEADAVLDKLAMAREIECSTAEGDLALQASITIETIDGEQMHVMRFMTQRQMRDFANDETITAAAGSAGTASWTNLSAYGALYDELRIDGPPCALPHKRAVLDAVSRAFLEMARSLGEAGKPGGALGD